MPLSTPSPGILHFLALYCHFLQTSHKWDHYIVYVMGLGLGSFTCHAFEIHLCCSYNLVSFIVEYYFIVWLPHDIFYPLTSQWMFEVFQFWAIISKDAMNIYVWGFVGIYVSISLGKDLGVVIVVLYGQCVLNFIRSCIRNNNL